MVDQFQKFRDRARFGIKDVPLPEERLSPEKKEQWYGERNHKQLIQDLITAFDEQHEIRKQQRKDRDLLVSALIDTQTRLDRANLKIWIMSLIVSPIIAAVGKAMWNAIFR